MYAFMTLGDVTASIAILAAMQLMWTCCNFTICYIHRPDHNTRDYVHPLLFFGPCVGSLTHHRITNKCCETGPRLLSLTNFIKVLLFCWMQMELQKKYFLLSYLNKDPECWSSQGSNPWSPAQTSSALWTEPSGQRFVIQMSQLLVNKKVCFRKICL